MNGSRAYEDDGRVEQDVAGIIFGQQAEAPAEELGDDYRPVDIYSGTEALVRSWGIEADRRHGHMRLMLPYVDADGRLRTHELLLDAQDAAELVDGLYVGMDHLVTGERPSWEGN